MTAELRRWGAAVIIALFLAAGRLFSDVVIPPHLRWWLTPVVAFSASLLTSWIWIIMLRLEAKGRHPSCACHDPKPEEVTS